MAAIFSAIFPKTIGPFSSTYAKLSFTVAKRLYRNAGAHAGRRVSKPAGGPDVTSLGDRFEAGSEGAGRSAGGAHSLQPDPERAARVTVAVRFLSATTASPASVKEGR